MRLPIDWLNEYVDLKGKSLKEIADALTVIGLMQDKIETNPDVIEVEQRLNRVDLLSILGVARDLAAYFDLPLKKPELYDEPKTEPENLISIKIECPDKVRRFNTRVFKNVKVGPSPDWLKTRLEAYGIPSKNNIVDITNYVMVELGQPMHAQDIAKLRKPEIVFRNAEPGEKIVTLLGEEVELVDGSFVATQDGVATIIGGIVGGKETGVDESTKDIVLDAGNYNQNVIRSASRKLKIMNETVQRYDKYLHPELTQQAIQRASALILELAGGEYHNNYDYYPEKYGNLKLKLRKSRLAALSGMDFDNKTILRILGALEFELTETSTDVWDVVVPTHRTDIEVEDDLVSEVLRINDYNNIPVTPINAAPPTEITPQIYKFEEMLKDELTRLGVDEHRTDPLVSSANQDQQIKLLNALTSEKSALRQDVYETLQAVVTTYQKHGAQEIAVFEIGIGYTLDGDPAEYASYKEHRELVCVYQNSTLDIKAQSVNLHAILAGVLKHIGLDAYYIDDQDNILVNEEPIGKVFLSHFTLDTTKLLKLSIYPKHPQRVLSEVLHPTKFELSLIVKHAESFGQIYKTIRDFENILGVRVVEEYSGEKVELGTRAVLVEIETTESDPTAAREKLLAHLQSKFDIQHRNQ